MKKLPAAFIFLLICLETTAGIRLMALTDAANPSVTLRWNMINYPGTTAYSLFKSMDGITWSIIAANPVFRNYNSSTVLMYRDNFSNEQKLYYRVKVYDANDNIVDVSNTVIVDNPKNLHTVINPSTPAKKTPVQEQKTAGGNSWQIFPNPARDMLNLAYNGNELIRGVINIVILDGTGKAVIRFRAASNNKQLHIPVNSLRTGIYFIKINVANDMQMNDKFIKE